MYKKRNGKLIRTEILTIICYLATYSAALIIGSLTEEN